MYKQIEADKEVPGLGATPVATLADEHGGRIQIVVDDRCYVCYLTSEDTGYARKYRPTSWIFPELLDVLKNLPKI